MADLRVETLALQESSGAQADYTAQANFVIARIHSDSSNAFRARKLIPKVPNFAALPSCGAPLKTSARQVISKSTKPAATTVACSSASSRAPAIHPFHKSMFRLAPAPNGFCTRISPI